MKSSTPAFRAKHRLGGLERIDWVLEMENVDVLVLELGANDLLRGVPVKKMKENLDKIIRKAKAKKRPRSALRNACAAVARRGLSTRIHQRFSRSRRRTQSRISAVYSGKHRAQQKSQPSRRHSPERGRRKNYDRKCL